jgi:hypothetical protein
MISHQILYGSSTPISSVEGLEDYDQHIEYY